LNRNLYVALGVFAAATIFAGCGSGGATIGSNPISSASLAPGVTPSPTPLFSLAPGSSPTPTPTGATPSPTPTANIGANGAVYHPGDNGDAFTMNGTLTITYDRANQYPTPEPTSTTFDTVVQSVAVTNPASFNGTSGVEFAVSETDSQTAPESETFTDTLDEYFQYSNTMVTGEFLNLGSTETDDTGYTTTLTNGANDMLADKLPEVSGDTWTNMAGRTITTNDGHGETSTTTYNDDGSYSGTITYPEAATPAPNPTGSQLTNTATLVANVDGSADYQTPRFGTNDQYNYDYKILAPTASGSTGTISETTTVPPAVGSTSTPEAVSTTVANWMPATVPGSLASESDVDNGPVSLPGVCVVPSSLAGTPNEIVQTKMRVDPLNGELETTTTTTFDTANVGPICVVLQDTQSNYYDFTGQNGTGYFSGTPQQVTTISEVLYLTAESLDTIARHPEARGRNTVARAVNVATAQMRIAIARNRTRMRAFDLASHRVSPGQSHLSFRGLLK
jgi:hypothetical protein